MPHKQPVSILAVIYTADLQVLLLERADHPGYWQSVTGSRDGDEALRDTVMREVEEETGLKPEQYTLHDWQYQKAYEIYPHWRHRYAPGVTENTEHVYGLELPGTTEITIAPREHLQYTWLPLQQAAEKCFSPSNREAILQIPKRSGCNKTGRSP